MLDRHVWAIIPPIDAPTTWAASMPRASSRPTQSLAMSDSVYGHVRHRLAGQRRLERALPVDGDAVELRRQPAVAVVEADHVAPAGGEQLAELGVPARQLHDEAGDEQHGGSVGRSERLVLDVEEVGRVDLTVVLGMRAVWQPRVPSDHMTPLRSPATQAAAAFPATQPLWPLLAGASSLASR